MNKKWGTREWFENMFDPKYVNTIGDGWGTRWRGSQKFNYDFRIKMLKKLLPKKKMRILDIGCALGDFTVRVWQLNSENEIFVMDISKTAINYISKRYPNMQGVVGALLNLPFKENSFDLILCLEVLYYLNTKDQIKSLKNIKKVLKHDGHLFFSGGLDGGIRYFAEDEIIELISKYFDIGQIEYHYTKIFTAVERKFLYLLAICDIVKTLSNMSNEDFLKWYNERNDKRKAEKVNKFRKIMNKFPFGWIIVKAISKFMSLMIKRILSRKTPVILSYKLTKLIMVEKGKTGITLWAKSKNSKKSEYL